MDVWNRKCSTHLFLLHEVIMKPRHFFVLIVLFGAACLYGQQSVNVDQAGMNNEIIIEQLGQNNQADVIQRVNNSTSQVEQTGSNNEVYQLNSANSSGYINDQYITQTGNNNRAVQMGLNGTGYGVQQITQTGFNNYASQLRRGDASSAYITQLGTRNEAEEKIFAASDHAKATIIQDGNDNTDRIHIEGSQALSGHDKAIIETHGNDNGRLIDAVSINLVGDNHTARIYQGLEGDVNSNQASINLVGNFSNAATGSNATITQEYGNNNSARINSVGISNGTSTENGLEIVQHGSNNLGELNVFGVGLEGSIIQLGNNMTVRVTRTN